MKRVFFGLLAISFFAFFSCSKFGSSLMKGSRKFEPKSGVYYSLFVRSFADSDGDGIGDFNGIFSKLDYLEELGITGIWLLPIYASHSYHGYDVDDYYQTNPQYGTIKEFERLCDECKRRSIAIILDLPLNHSSIHNQWFRDSIDPKNPKRSWYRWAAPDEPEINLKGSAWGHKVWNLLEGNYYSGLYSSEMPDFNHDNPEVRAEFRKIMAFWLSKGISGFRFDAANHLYDAVKMPVSVKNCKERAIAFWTEMVDYVLSVKPSSYMVGEVWDSDGVRADYMRALPSTFHFDLGSKIIDVVKKSDAANNSLAVMAFNAYTLAAEENPNFIDAPFLTNHDQNRSALHFKNDPESIKLAASLYLFLPGIPFVYYGEELGMNGAKPDEQIRSPFLWSKLSSNFQTSWMESKYNANTIPVDQQNPDRNSILNYYRKAIKFRVQNEGYFKGVFYPEKTKNDAIVSWMYLLKGGKRLWCFFNVSDEEQVFSRPSDSDNAMILFSQKNGSALTSESLRLPAKSCMLFGNIYR